MTQYITLLLDVQKENLNDLKRWFTEQTISVFFNDLKNSTQFLVG